MIKADMNSCLKYYKNVSFFVLIMTAWFIYYLPHNTIEIVNHKYKKKARIILLLFIFVMFLRCSLIFKHYVFILVCTRKT